MRHPVRRPNQRRTLSGNGIREPHTVAGTTERNVLPRRGLLLFPRRRSLGPRGLGFVEGADELVATAAHGPDVALRFPVIAKGPTRRLDPTGQRRLTDEPATPHRIEQFLLGDHPVVVADQLVEHVEHLRLDPDHLGAASQFKPADVEHEIIEAICARRFGLFVLRSAGHYGHRRG